jgi:hypothetical protein
MDNQSMIAAIDEEIARLQQVRSLLGAGGFPGPSKGKTKRKWVMSAEARAKISAAQRKRWAAQKKGAK